MLRFPPAMTSLKRARSLTPPTASLATAAGPAGTSAHPAKRTHLDAVFLPRKIATAEATARADAHTPFAQLQAAPTASVAVGDAVVYWMRMQDMRGACGAAAVAIS